MSQLAIDKQAPDFELKDLHGNTYGLADALQRGPVALVFYKGSCPTCQFTFPFLQRILAEATADHPALWGISQDEAGETQEFAKQFGITFPLLIDDHPYAVSSAYGLRFVPAVFLIQPDGTIAASDYGFSKNALNEIAGFDFFKSDDGLPARRPG